jgi:RHS repeat-associated protein
VNGVLVKGWLYADQLRPIAEIDGSGTVVSRFVYGAKPNVPEYVIKNGETYRIFSDHIGTPRVVVDAATAAVVQRLDVQPFGEIIQDTNPGWQPFGFAGGLYDPDTRLILFGAREYDPQTGRWTSKDPIRFEGRDENLYGYVLLDPTNLVDPSGLDWIDTGLRIGADFSAGFGDTLTSGFGIAGLLGLPSATEAARSLFPGGDPVSACSLAYQLGGYAGDAWGVAAGGALVARRAGYEVWLRRYPKAGGGGMGIDRLGKNLIRLDWHPFKQGGKMLNRPHVDIPGKAKHWPW